MLRKWINLAACAAIPAGFAGQPTTEDILKQLELLQQQVRQQQAVIEELRGRIDTAAPAASSEEVSTLVQQEVTAAMEKHALSAAGDGPFLKLGSNIDGIKLTGDLRLRYEYNDRSDQNASNRDRLRTRFRLGGVWQNSTENWEIGAGVATGGADPTSTNDTWSEGPFFETGDLRLDYAYAKHRTKICDANITATLGQQSNPFVGSWLLYDTDVRPVGFTLQADQAGLFGTVGFYDVYNGRNEICEMWGAQAGYKFKIENIKGTIALAYYLYNDSVWKDYAPANMYGDQDFDFSIGDVYADLTVPLGEKASVKLFGEFFRNFGAEGGAGQGFLGNAQLNAEDENSGWLAGADFKVDRFTFGYCYAVLEENAALPGLVDSDFGVGLNSVDIAAHRLTASYNVSKNFSIGLMAQSAKALERSGVGDVDVYMVDLVYKF